MHCTDCRTMECLDSKSGSLSRLPSLSQNIKSSFWARLNFVSSPSPASTSSSPTSSSSSSALPPLYSSNSDSSSPGSTSVSSNLRLMAVCTEVIGVKRLRFNIGSPRSSDHTSQSSQTTYTPSPRAYTSSRHGTNRRMNTVFSLVPEV
ncbi:hypothetical protein I314_03602 [Cryptococcus bacillisporus CA1873]|uniref:Uncharacterized protein n=1 Tax=Cryptococcus bacillisporus CA1873 TaxID=1296111 RepID=A0ABR5B9P2_CRYGA|nr:hypothetical protein I314_03602 [Cryptococcus bacillisporus CA1873]|eukprot:KIR60311.1 hypothetical protein I314_03602 [Cryptococcus gattii CA1873]